MLSDSILEDFSGIVLFLFIIVIIISSRINELTKQNGKKHTELECEIERVITYA